MRVINKGATSQSIYFTVLDSSSTTGGRLTGLVHNAAGLTAYYTRAGAAAVQITLATLASASAAWSSGGLILVSDANAPGLIRLDVPDAAFASGVDSVVITLKGATNMAQVDIEVQLVALNLQDTVRAGLTALPNVASGSAGAIITAGTGTAQLSVSSGLVELTAAGVDAIFDEVVLGSYTLRQLVRGISAATLGKVSGAATTTITIRSANDSKDVIVATVDADGNRSAITLDLT